MLWCVSLLELVDWEFLMWQKSTRFLKICHMHVAFLIAVFYEECYRFWKVEREIMSDLDPANLLLFIQGIFWFLSLACQLIAVLGWMLSVWWRWKVQCLQVECFHLKQAFYWRCSWLSGCLSVCSFALLILGWMCWKITICALLMKRTGRLPLPSWFVVLQSAGCYVRFPSSFH